MGTARRLGRDDNHDTKARARDISPIQKTFSLGRNGTQHRALPSRVVAEGDMKMRDLLADWNKWNSAERLLALVLALTLISLPCES
jgi:hypothetical protein